MPATLATVMLGSMTVAADDPIVPPPAVDIRPTDLGINLFGLQTFNREPVFANLIAHSEWFVSQGAGWQVMPAAQLDRAGWVRALAPRQVAPRPLMLSPTQTAPVSVRCTFHGKGDLSAGGIAQVVSRSVGTLDLDLAADGTADDKAWIQLDATDPADPLRNLDCRAAGVDRSQIFEATLIASLKGFAAIRFLDWQRVNDNRVSRWSTRTRPDDATQVGPGGVAIEHMIALANAAHADPWFIMPYQADAEYITAFARLVHAELAPDLVAHVELGNEVWNDMFDASRQARAEGLAARLAPADDPYRAQLRRYAQKSRDALRIWTVVFRDRPQRLVRVVATHNAYPASADIILSFEDLARWTDALAIAPYIHLDLAGKTIADIDAIFAQLGPATDATLDFAVSNRAIAARHGKRLITYEGGQHLVTRDLALAMHIQRDPRMEGIYRAYLDRWRTRLGDRMMLYASTTPIGEHGSWGLREYAGQPLSQTPKLRAVRAFIGGGR